MINSRKRKMMNYFKLITVISLINIMRVWKNTKKY